MIEGARQSLRILVVDDHRAVAESIAMAIDLQPDMRCVGIAATIAETRAVFLTSHPDVLLTDVRLPDGDGVDASRSLLELDPDLRVVVLTAFTDVELVARVASIGGCGLLPKESSISSVLSALRKAGEGAMSVDGGVLSVLLEDARGARPAVSTPAVTLTERETEVLGCLSQGLDPQTIARRLGISVHTCRGHVKSILGKLEAHSQLEAVVKAMRWGLVPDPEAGR